MNGFILTDDSFREFRFEILKLICIGFGYLRNRDARPLSEDHCNIIDRKCSGVAVCIGLYLILKEREPFLKLLFFLFKCLRSFEVLAVDCGFFLFFDLSYRFLEFILNFGISIIDSLCGSCFIYKVDGLIRKESVRYISCGKPYGLLENIIGDIDLVMLFILAAKTLHDGDRVLDRRLFYQHFLEPSLESMVLLYELGIFIKRRGTDYLELVLCKKRLHYIGGIHRTSLGFACTDKSVDLVDEQYDIRI